MTLPQIFGEYTKPDFISWLMSAEGQKHLDEVFTPADTELNATTAMDHKFGRCVWMAMQVLTKKPTDRTLELIFEAPSTDFDPGATVSEYIATRKLPLKWRSVSIDEI